MHDKFRVFLFVLWRHLTLLEPTGRQYTIAQYVANAPAAA